MIDVDFINKQIELSYKLLLIKYQQLYTHAFGPQRTPLLI